MLQTIFFLFKMLRETIVFFCFFEWFTSIFITDILTLQVKFTQ